MRCATDSHSNEKYHVIKYRRHQHERWETEVVRTGYLRALAHATQLEHILCHHKNFELTIYEVTDEAYIPVYDYKSIEAVYGG
jgi:hypothetical protein